MPARSPPTWPASPRPANASPEAFQLFATGSRQYLAVATIFGAGVALCDVIALTILDIRYAWLWGLLAFITNYIPNVGFIIGLVPPAIVALLDHDAKTAHRGRHHLLRPQHHHPKRHPAPRGRHRRRPLPTLSFLSLLVWAAILGGVGAFLAVPATLFVKALFIDVDPDRRWVTPLLSSSACTPTRPTIPRRERAKRSADQQHRSSRAPDRPERRPIV